MAQPSYKEFTHKWIENLIDSIDAHLDEETRIALMESCGRACAHRGPVHAARECQGDLDAWLVRLAKWHGGEEHVQSDGDVAHLTCTECLCDLVKDGPARLPDTYCHCSRGWMKEVFKTVVGKPVGVDLVESIKRGGQRCQFTIHLWHKEKDNYGTAYYHPYGHVVRLYASRLAARTRRAATFAGRDGPA